ncbi:two-component system, OmpR family, phosphate regulon sensor histidine kinase PhoR [Roseovarius nanhaiticus]|uniref:histidine kinase n=1 Tax=Roseovarius nanhaiticus TaxID=573024 RepID=A0A1N7EN56_9RHOB|nr:ATP-binding protein [Roseovarius nanhaiticus]SEK70838.1 two-component system, OmpR family, phosphate regulon sensor histidine kinase PhoR [Roseovarius nanhaiticus]SIR89528.1 two-component system, OmpR family, phosphate regulon sensor histidine kinase PhoR [Roseovarius nanhaiticus]
MVPNEALVAAIPIPALLIGADMRVIAANAAAEAVLGSAGIGGHLARIIRTPAVLDAVETCRNSAAAAEAQFMADEAGQDTLYDVTCAPAGEAVLICLRDVSTAMQTDMMRREFVANVSHELRTPLTALSGFIETLRGPAKGDVAATDRFLTIMQGEAARMERLVHDLLSLSRVEAQQRHRPKAEVDLRDICTAARDTMRGLAEEAGAEVMLSLPGAPVMVLGDADQLRQVCVNLIENALKYGASGGKVAVSLTIVAQDAQLREPAAILSVRDDGPGIDPIHIPRLTERFYRIDNHRARAMGGTGLGLAIVKHIAQRHRGRLTIESAPGAGCEIRVLLPLAADARGD